MDIYKAKLLRAGDVVKDTNGVRWTVLHTFVRGGQFEGAAIRSDDLLGTIRWTNVDLFEVCEYSSIAPSELARRMNIVSYYRRGLLTVNQAAMELGPIPAVEIDILAPDDLLKAALELINCLDNAGLLVHKEGTK